MEPPHRAPPPHGAELASCSPRPQAGSGERASGKQGARPYLNHVPELLSGTGPPKPRLPNRHGAALQPLSRMEGVCLLLAALSAAAPGQGTATSSPSPFPSLYCLPGPRDDGSADFGAGYLSPPRAGSCWGRRCRCPHTDVTGGGSAPSEDALQAALQSCALLPEVLSVAAPTPAPSRRAPRCPVGERQGGPSWGAGDSGDPKRGLRAMLPTGSNPWPCGDRVMLSWFWQSWAKTHPVWSRHQHHPGMVFGGDDATCSPWPGRVYGGFTPEMAAKKQPRHLRSVGEWSPLPSFPLTAPSHTFADTLPAACALPAGSRHGAA